MCEKKCSNLSLGKLRASINERIEIYLYGEWIHRNCQTADSNLDKYNYKQRGILPGHLYAFGLGIVLLPESATESSCEKYEMSTIKHR